MRHNFGDDMATVGIDIAAAQPARLSDFMFQRQLRQKVKKVCSEGHHGEVIDTSEFLRRQVVIIDSDFHPKGNPRLTEACHKEASGLSQEAVQANLMDGLVRPSSKESNKWIRSDSLQTDVWKNLPS